MTKIEELEKRVIKLEFCMKELLKLGYKFDELKRIGLEQIKQGDLLCKKSEKIIKELERD